MLQQIQLFWFLGINGTKKDVETNFSNPFDQNRRVFVFYDAPHTLKNTMNCLVQKNHLKVII